jgi:GNAT superfamily N-acetyltransferase
MDDTPHTLTGSAARFAPKENLYAFMRSLSRLPSAEAAPSAEGAPSTEGGEGGGLLRWFTGIPDSMFNGVLARRPAQSDESATIQAAVDYFSARPVGEMSWWLASQPGLEGWGDQLLAHGFHYTSGPPGMSLDLAHLPAPALPEGLRIERVSTPEQLQVWVNIFLAGYGVPAEAAPGFFRLLDDLGYDQPARNYLGYIEDRPATTSSVYFGAGVAGIYCVATLPEFRRRGLGAAMTISPLHEARELGYQTAILQSSQMGYPVYQRIGFRTTCQVDYYALKLE